MIPFLMEVSTPEWFSELNYESWIRVLVLTVLGFPGAYMASSVVGKIVRRGSSEHAAVFVKKMVLYVLILLVVLTILIQLGFNLSAILGAAGIASIAIGFAAQTSLSNVISGLFLYWERPFEIGDIIKVGDTLGIVLSIDLMSVKIRTFENQFIRIPNETIIKSETTTVTRFPIRRLTIRVGVSYHENIPKVVETLKRVAEQNPYCLDEPEPLILFDDFGDSSLNFVFGPWFEKTQFLLLKNSIMHDIKRHFDEAGIEIPFPQRVITFVGEKDGDISNPSNPKEEPTDMNDGSSANA
jgi:small-conductance mechanosensitive channel